MEQDLKDAIDEAIEYKIETGSNAQLLPLMQQMRDAYSIMSHEEEDYRSGQETYGYEDQESIQNNLVYISDRWRCAFRLRWLLDGLSEGHI